MFKSSLLSLLFLFSSVGMSTTYPNRVEKSLAQAYREHSPVQTRLAQDFLKKIPLKGDEVVLDIGCGDGRVTDLISKRVPLGKVKGIDVSADMIDLAQKSFPEISFEQADGATYSDDIKYDVIVCFSTIHWFTDQQAVLNNMKKLLKENGRMYILSYSPYDYYWKPMEDSVFSRKWSGVLDQNQFHAQLPRDELTKEIEQAGFLITSLNVIPEIVIFDGQEGYKKHVTGFLPHLRNLPKEQHEELLKDIGESFLKWNKPNSEGKIIQPHHIFEVMVAVAPSKTDDSVKYRYRR
ncbi:MAG: class I SAM-dependent methyltransferase [Candidatus Cloacimonetes bacterium]|nr:class I SAM-dependent methyltransferase [Candidatus Cloacimonadota bacterium]